MFGIYTRLCDDHRLCEELTTHWLNLYEHGTWIPLFLYLYKSFSHEWRSNALCVRVANSPQCSMYLGFGFLLL